MGRLADYALKVFSRDPPSASSESEDDGDESLTICDALQGALKMTSGFVDNIPVLGLVHTACTQILEVYQNVKSNAIDFEALMQRIATTVEIINHGLERLDEGARESLKTHAEVFCMELGKFRDQVTEIQDLLQKVGRRPAWKRWMFNHKTKSSLEAHKQTLQARMEKFVLGSTVEARIQLEEIKLRIQRLEQQDADRRERSRRIEMASATQADTDAKENIDGEPLDVVRHGRKRAVLRQAGLDAVPPLAAYIIDASLWFIVPWWRANFG